MEQKWKDRASLRFMAEEAVVGAVTGLDSGMSRDALLHDLLVQDAELRMQNEALVEARDELHQVHRRYEDLFDNAPVGYVVVDSATRIVAVNGRAAAVLGETPESLRGERLSRFVVADEAIPFERYRREVANSESGLIAEFTMRKGGGERCEVRLESVCTNPNTGEWRIALTDVTLYNGMIRRLDHGERLGAVERHASSIAHDLNNLLYSILGHADIALRFLEPAAHAYAPLVRLREVVNRCAEATKQLSSFSRAEEAQPAIVDLNGAIAKLEGVLRSLLGGDVTLELNATAPDAAVRLDPDHIEQILLTCVRNACHAMPHGGTFQIETATVELNVPMEARGAASTRFVRWLMSDTGVGMSESTRRRAFEPFFTTKPPGVGTGLGLAMVKAAVERAGGFAALESELGRGTTLVLYLPRATGTSVFPPALSESTDFGPACARVLLVKETPDGVADLVARIRAAGCEVLLSGSGSGALTMLRTYGESLSVLLVDKMLPEVAVAELMRAAQVVSPDVDVIIAPLSAYELEAANDTASERENDFDELVRTILAIAVRANVH